MKPSNVALASDVEIVRRLLAHIDAGTTDEGESWREPVANYLDPARFAAELKLLRSLPSVLIPSAALPSPGDHIERVVFGAPLFAVRDREQRVRVFRNACRHRGAALVQGSGCSRALVCPYHGWTYRLDGSLSHVPHAHGFPDLDVAARGLVEVVSAEVAGLIVIAAVAPTSRSADATSALGALGDGSAWRDKLQPELRVFDISSRVLPMNWKLLMEQFLEGYHIRTTHRDTFYPVQYDNLNVVELFGPHSRVTYPFRNIERLRNRPEADWTVGHRVTFLYQLFPNVMLATFPDRVVMVAIDPIDLDHSLVSTYSMGEPRETAAGAAQPRERSDGINLVQRGTLEDNAMTAAVQKGLLAGANEFLEFGRHESAIGHFHATLRAQLASMTDVQLRS